MDRLKSMPVPSSYVEKICVFELEFDVYAFDDFRTLLSERFKALKKQDSSVTYSSLSRKAELKSISYIHNIFFGKKRVSPEILERLCVALQMNQGESRYVICLSNLNLAENLAEKEFYAREILKIRGFKKRFPLSQVYAKFYSTWYYSPLFELLGLPSFSPDKKWINKELGTDLSDQEILSALEDLKSIGLAKQTYYGKWSRIEKDLVTDEQVSSHFVLKYHQEMIRIASERIGFIDQDHREVVSITASINSKHFNQYRDKVRQFYAEMYELFSDEKTPDSVYQLNIQLLPLRGNSSE